MKLLALDSATEACSAALYMDGAVRERFELAPRRHTALLLPMVQQLLAEAGIGLAELDALAFAQGPGSFTGLRIAAGVVQGLALGLDRPVIGISTLAALAARAQRGQGPGSVAVAMDARMGQVYWGLYGFDGDGQCRALALDSLQEPDRLPRLATGDWRPAGAGWLRHADALEMACGLRADAAALELYPHAEEVAWMAAERARRGEGVAAVQAQPVYLRQQVAEKMKGKTP